MSIEDSKVENIEKKIEQLAADLVLLDFENQEDYKTYLLNLSGLSNEVVDTELDVIAEMIASTTDQLNKVGTSSHSLVGKIHNYLISNLQNVIREFRQGKDLKQSAQQLANAIKELISGGTVGFSSEQLAEVQKNVLPDFISGAKATLEGLEVDLISLENSENYDEIIARILREFHTLKGECNLLSLSNVSDLAHVAETLIEQICSGQRKISVDLINGLLKVVDDLKRHLQIISKDFNKALKENFKWQKETLEGLMADQDDVKEKKADEQPVSQQESAGEEEFKATVPQLDMSEGIDMLQEFVTESMDHLSHSEEFLLTLETDPEDKEAIDAIFRSFHTIKGLSSFLALDDIQTLAHTAETMLDLVRKDEFSFQGPIVDTTFDSIDNLRKLLVLLNEQISNDGKLQSPYHDVGDLIRKIKSIIDGKEVHEAKDKKQVGEIVLDKAILEKEEVDYSSEKKEDSPGKKIGDILIEEGAITGDELDTALVVQSKSSGDKVGKILKDMDAVSSKEVNKALKIQKGIHETSIKINTEKLDALIELVGELVITETQVIQNTHVRALTDQRLVKDLAEMDRITRRLQEIAMGMRLVPVKSTFQKMLRIIRDLSKKSGKKIDVSLSGEDTEIDKNMVELISDPLVHMVRNAADHGIESFEERVNKGKSSTGHIELAAAHKAGNVVVEIKDDGAGLDKDKILSKAKERGIVKDNEQLSDSRIFQMIFEPGFSTADQVTDISGRGVGMDVVKRNIEQMRGKIDITSETDKGSVFSIQLPLTLAIIEGIVLLVGDERYILPINAVVEFVSPNEENLTTVVGKGEIVKVHDDVYPLIRLDRYFGVSSRYNDFKHATICVIESDSGRSCLLVDQLLGQQQVVIKSLGEKLSSVKGVSGGAILGDGRVGLILDVNGIVELYQKMILEQEETMAGTITV